MKPILAVFYELRGLDKDGKKVGMIETMNNYDDLAAKAKAKADAIREAIKEEMMEQPLRN